MLCLLLEELVNYVLMCLAICSLLRCVVGICVSMWCFFFVRERFANLHLYSDGKDGARRMRMGQLGWLDKGKHYNKHT